MRSATASAVGASSAATIDAVGEIEHAIRIGRGERVVGHHHHGLAERVDDVAQQVEDLAARAGVQRAGRLVGEHHLRAREQRAGDRDALLLAAGQLARAGA